MGSRSSCRVHARSDATKPIDEATIRWWRRLREGEEGKRAKSSVRGKTILWVFFFFCFAKSKIANSWRRANFLLPISFWDLANHNICQVRNSKLLEMLCHSIIQHNRNDYHSFIGLHSP